MMWIRWSADGRIRCQAGRTGIAADEVVNRLTDDGSADGSPPRAALQIDSGPETKVVVVVVDGLLLTGAPHTSNRHELNKP
ncbi:hypothetical protein A5647_19955 [Mycobacterium sp. 1100029.7]|nr:hypothetical protein A5647_19955 [Mycobacterium sp. 1100029.7]